MNNPGNKMGVMHLTILTAVNMLGSGIIMLPTKLAEVGTMSIISWLVTAFGSLALAWAFSKCGLFSTKSGGMGGYAEYAFGKSGNFIANYTYAISLLIANIAIAISAVGYGSVLLGIELSPVGVCLATIVVLWVTTVCNFGGAKITGQIGSVTVWGVIIPVVGLCVIGWFWFSPSLYASAWNPNKMDFFSAISTSISMTLWAFLGLESACANMDAVENPQKNVPIAVFGGTLVCAVINVIAGIVPNLDLLHSTAPFGLAYATMFTPTVGSVVMFLMALACIGSLLGWQFTVAQVFKSSSDIGYFPRIFSRVTKHDAPLVGMVILGVVQTGLALMTISPSLNKQFNSLVNLAVVTNLVPYVLSMAALIPMQRLASVSGGQAKMNTVIALIGTIYSFYALWSSGEEAMMLGALVTFSGWTFWGMFIEKKERQAENLYQG